MAVKPIYEKRNDGKNSHACIVCECFLFHLNTNEQAMNYCGFIEVWGGAGKTFSHPLPVEIRHLDMALDMTLVSNYTTIAIFKIKTI